uniref:THAP-type domain-containing protein n=1 Tax=Caenorhabditis tropicalis TaxID=1561998 RepID=A0A1I7SZD3_9PELO
MDGNKAVALKKEAKQYTFSKKVEYLDEIGDEVKEEPLDASFEERMPTLESNSEGNTDNQKENKTNNPSSSKTDIVSRNLKRKLSDECETSAGISEIEQSKCSLCLQSRSIHLMKTPITENDELILLVANVLKDRNNGLSDNGPRSICNFHFPEAGNQILKSLQIKTLDGVDACSSLTRRNMMLVVHLFSPKLQFWQFFNSFYTFAHENMHLTGIRTTGFKKLTCDYKDQLKEPRRRAQVFIPPEQELIRCQLCQHVRCRPFINILSLKSHKLVIAVARIIRKQLTLRNAFSFVSRTEALQICRQHYLEDSSEILNFLQIGSVDEIATCPLNLKERLMFTVNLLSPRMSIEQLSYTLHSFRFIL